MENTARQASRVASPRQHGRSGGAGNPSKVQAIAKPVDLFEKGLPVNLDAERFVLGSVLIDDSKFVEVSALEL